MTNKSDTLTQSLIDYINDVKPYHTKFRDVSSQIFFTDSFNVNFKENHTILYNLQNVWGRSDVNGFSLTNMSEGSLASTPGFTGTGSGSLSSITMTVVTVVVETWTLTATSPTTFSVVGSVSGAQAAATVNVPYDNGIVQFTINSGVVAFIAGDAFAFDVYGDQAYPIPAAVFPRFSLNDRLQYGQTPHGDDPATQDLTDADLDGIPDSEVPWITNAGNFVVGNIYTIKTLGTTDFTMIGAASNAVGIKFTATGVGDPLTTGKASLKTASHQLGWYDHIPVEAPVISASIDPMTGNYNIVIDTTDEVVFNFTNTVQKIKAFVNNVEFSTDTIGSNCTNFTKAPDFPIAGQATITIVSPSPPIINIANTVSALWLETGRYAVPYHQGSRITVDEVEQTFGNDYIVDKSRSFIQFLPTVVTSPPYVPSQGWPVAGANVDINIFRSDRLFICWQDPFAHGTTPDEFTINAVAAPQITAAGSFTIGDTYKILTVGTTNFVNAGATSDTVGLTFTATAVGAGTGTAASSTLMKTSLATAQIVKGHQYKILIADPNFALPELGGSNVVGATFTATKSGTAIAGDFIVGAYYRITSSGNTDFVSIGAPDNLVGTGFTATGVGVGTGIAELWSLLGTPGIIAPTVVCNVTFSNSQPGTHKATLQRVMVTDVSNLGTWTVTATGPWTFSVKKGLTSFPAAAFKTLYNDGVGVLSFIIDSTWANYYTTPSIDYDAYYIEQDVNSYISYDLLPLGISDAYDASEFFSNLSVVSEHGDVNSILQHPVRYEQFGRVIKKTTGDYVFEFDTIPPIYTYIEFRVEQEGQYNPWLNATIEEAMRIIVTFYLNGIIGALLKIGDSYTILDPGTINFTLLGSPDNNVGTIFTYNGTPIAGSGTVTQVITGAGPS